MQVVTAAGALVGVLALAVLTMRLAGGRLLPGSRHQRLRLQEHLALGREGSLWLVQAGGRTLLLGSAGRSVSVLADLTEAAGAEAPAAQVAAAAAPGFATALEASLHRLRRLSGEGGVPHDA